MVTDDDPRWEAWEEQGRAMFGSDGYSSHGFHARPSPATKGTSGQHPVRTALDHHRADEPCSACDALRARIRELEAENKRLVYAVNHPRRKRSIDDWV